MIKIRNPTIPDMMSIGIYPLSKDVSLSISEETRSYLHDRRNTCDMPIKDIKSIFERGFTHGFNYNHNQSSQVSES